ncbi:hypothetical protein [Sinorhizobium saheli]|uniref:hypothetical protein n=1 Tax=Sinorhizobium saheli TaxID=36856 RepID=UPI000AD5D1C4|nr:hypothetical protein [Sinorhizobium saheli]MQW89882.1 hypothetical protein [Sinorhizobium saheli]
MPKKRIAQGLRNAGRELLFELLNDKVNLPEAYADRIARDYGNSWHDAYQIYRQNPTFWDDAYNGDPNNRQAGPKIAPVTRTSRLPVTDADEGSSFWERLFPGRTSLRRAPANWRE